MCHSGNETERLKDFLGRLEHYVNMDTPSGDTGALNGMSGELGKEFEAAGCQVTVHSRPGGNILECCLGSGKRQILLLGHMDTVFTRGEAERRPFSVQGEVLHGPGVLDMKSGVLMILEIMRRFAGRLPDDWRLCAVLNADEEIGSGESRDLIIDRAAKSAACLCMEPSKPGYCTVGRKGMITFRITTEGVAAHSGVNYLMGRSAIQALCHIVERLYGLRDDEGGVSVNVGGISGGTDKGNIVAKEASLIGEVRFYQPEEERFLEAIRKCCEDTGVPDVTCRLTIHSRRPPMLQTSPSRALYELARRAAGKNGLALEGRVHGGGSDGSLAASAGIPVIDGMGAEGEFSHTEEEYVRADTLMRRLETNVTLIQMIIDGKLKGKGEANE